MPKLKQSPHKVALKALMALDKAYPVRTLFWREYCDTLDMSLQMFQHLARHGAAEPAKVDRFYRAMEQAGIPLPSLQQMDPLTYLRRTCGPVPKKPL